MLPRANRIPASEMRIVLKTGKRIQTSWLQLVTRKNTHSLSRFAFIVSKRVDKRATVRNRLKRLLRESIHHLLPMIVPGWDSVLTVRSKPAKDNQKAVEITVSELLQQSDLL